MKALRFHAAKDLRLEEISAPVDPGPDQVVIQNSFCGICGTDLHEYASGPILVPTEPHPHTGAFGAQVLGHEYGGVVAKVGRAVSHVKEGDRVSVQPLIMPRKGDYYSDRGFFHLSDQIALAGLSWVSGGMAQSSLLNDYNVVRIPDSLSDEDAALVEPTAVAVYACDRGGVTAGSSVLVTGAGPIGILCLLAARAAGATKLFLSDVNPTRLSLAQQIIPDAITIDAGREDVGNVVRERSEAGVGCDVAIEAVGHGAPLKDCVDAVRKRGVVVQVGLHPGEAPVDWFQVTFKDIDIRGSWAYPTFIWPRVIGLIDSGQIQASKIVTKKVTLEKASSQGFDALLDPAGTELKILIDCKA